MSDDLPELRVTRCPSCDAEIDDLAVLCVSCGYHLQKGIHLSRKSNAEAEDAGLGEHHRSTGSAVPPVDTEILERARIGAVVLSVLIYAALCGIHLSASVRETSVKAFGPTPLGISVTAVVIAAQTLLYVPMPFVFYHAMILIFRSQEEGSGSPRGAFSMLAFLAEAEKEFPELKRSVYICVGGVFYVGAIAATWIWYASRLGI